MYFIIAASVFLSCVAAGGISRCFIDIQRSLRCKKISEILYRLDSSFKYIPVLPGNGFVLVDKSCVILDPDNSCTDEELLFVAIQLCVRSQCKSKFLTKENISRSRKLLIKAKNLGFNVETSLEEFASKTGNRYVLRKIL